MLNYTTKIEATKTVVEVQQILTKQGVRKIIIDYDDERQPIGLTFVVIWNEVPTLFALPCRWEGVLAALKRSPKTPRSQCTKEHALNVAWRILKDWTEAQLAIIEAGMVSLPEVFLPYSVTKDGGTLYELASGNRAHFQLNEVVSVK